MFVNDWLRLQRSQWFDRKRLEVLQVKALRKIVRYACSNVPFYKKLYKSVLADPSNIKSLDDLRKLPIVTKDLFRSTPVKERLSANFSVSECYRKRTSGSTGEPLEILEEPNVYNHMRGYQIRRLLSYGYRPWDTVVTLDPRRVDRPSTSEVSSPLSARLLRRGFRNVPMPTSPREQLESLKRLKPNWIFGNPSEMRAIGQSVETGSSLGFHLKGILTWGELLDEGTRKYIRLKLGTDVFDGYGAIEVAPLGGLAWECGEHGFHINADCVVLEFLKDGEPVSPGEEGEVVATSLFRHAMPAIRYELHDYAVPNDEPCKCGRGLPLLKSLEGRRVDCLVADDGQLVSPFRIIVALQQIAEVMQYQVIQEDQEHITVNLSSADGSISSEKTNEVIKVCKSLVGEGLKISVNAVAAIDKTPGKKFQPVICKIKK